MDSGGGLTTEDLAHARGIRWWIVDVPEVPEGQTLSLAFVDDHGVIDSRACPEVKAGDQVKVVLSGFSEWNLRYSLVVGDQAYRSTIINYLGYIDGPQGESVQSATVGDWLVSKSDTKWVDGKSQRVEGRSLSITMMFQEEVQTWQRTKQRWWHQAYAQYWDDGKVSGEPFASE